ncbi:GL25064, related [Eimeria mitis]|uniref:GL25064, related n=1 Tax=Eimeria mitis TaxID=44415 RepID=U6K8H5_9EIME|nr:GL25064, related [Eimeria mitis]CDJ34305.1 GL25064, related [Eimeria mitis]
MWGQHLLAAFLLLGNAAFCAAKQPAHASRFSDPVSETALSHAPKANEPPVNNLSMGNPEAQLVALVSAATGAIEDDEAGAVISLEVTASQIKGALAAAQKEEAGEASPSGASSSAIRGRKMMLFGVVLLIVGITLSMAASRPRPLARTQTSSMEETLQTTLDLMDKLGVKSASKLAVGCIIAGLVEWFRSIYGNQNNASQSGEGTKPALKGRLLAVLGVAALVASLAFAGIDFSTLDVSELIKVILEFISKAHIGLFMAGGVAFLKSAYEVLEHYKKLQQQQQQQQQGDGVQPLPESQPGSGVEGEGSIAEGNDNQGDNGDNKPSDSPAGESGPADDSTGAAQDEPAAGAEGGEQQDTSNATEDVPDAESGTAPPAEDVNTPEDSKDQEGGEQAGPDQGATEEVPDAGNEAADPVEDVAAPEESTEQEAGEPVKPEEDEAKEEISDAESEPESTGEDVAAPEEVTDKEQEGEQVNPDEGVAKDEVSDAESGTEGASDDEAAPEEETDKEQEGEQVKPDEGVAKDEVSDAETGAESAPEDAGATEGVTEQEPEAGEQWNGRSC